MEAIFATNGGLKQVPPGGNFFRPVGRRFKADPDLYKLACEANRIRLAHLFDPLFAVHTSDVQPLPHQLAAVEWDCIVCDEAHKMIAQIWGKKVEETKRYNYF